jgi:lipopolysaccharide biosynthesis glycosyltransferase
MPLATTLRSVIESSWQKWPIEFFILYDNFSESVREKVASSLPEGSAKFDWLPVDTRLFERFLTIPHVSKMTYARLLLPSILPKEVSRVLYLDGDILALDDLGPLWQTELKDAPVGAVSDLFLHTLYLSKGLDPAKERADHFRYKKELPRVRDYFNAGVMLIDLKRWREERISEKAFDYLKRYPASPHMDQDALNFALDEQWAKLNPRWNVQDHYRRIRLRETRRPGIVHFVTKAKPWLAASRSANAGLYDSFRCRTRFARTGRERAGDAVVRFTTGVRNVLKRGVRQSSPLPSLNG